MRIASASAAFLCLTLLSACSAIFPSNYEEETASSSSSISISSAARSASSVAASSSVSSVGTWGLDEHTIRECYRLIAIHDFEKAYDLYSVKKVSLATFQGWYKDVTGVEVSGITMLEPNTYTFTVNMNEGNNKTGKFVVKMYVKDGKLETKSSTQVEGTMSQTFSNKDLGIEFDYPNGWPAPEWDYVSREGYEGNESDNPFDPPAMFWQMQIGKWCKGCAEGTDVRNFTLIGYSSSRAPDLEAYIRKIDAIHYIVREFTIDGYKVIEYNEGGMCGNRSALMYGKKYSYYLYGRCAEDNKALLAEFSALLASFRILKD